MRTHPVDAAADAGPNGAHAQDLDAASIRELILELAPTSSPEGFVRTLSAQERRRLQRIIKTSTHPVRLRRAAIVMASAGGESVPNIAAQTATTAEYVRLVVHDFNARGFTALEPDSTLWTEKPHAAAHPGKRRRAGSRPRA